MTKRFVSKLLLLFVLVIALAAIGLYVFFDGFSIAVNPRYFFTLLSAPQELKQALFVTEQGGVTSLSRIYRGGVKTRTFDNKKIVDMAQGGDVLVAVMEQTGSGAVDVYRVPPSGALIPLSEDGMPKGNVSVSLAGDYIAFTEIGPAVDGAPEDAYDVRRYTTVVLNNSGKELVRIQGNYPNFLDRSKLFVSSEVGHIVYDIETGDASVVPEETAFLPVEPRVWGANGFITMRNFLVPGEIEIVRLYSITPLLYDVVENVPVGEKGAVALSDTEGLYVFEAEGDVMHVSRYPLSEGTMSEPVFSVPASLFNPTAVIF